MTAVMVLEYRSLTRTGSNPVSGTGKATFNTLSGSAGLALGFGLAMAKLTDKPKTKQASFANISMADELGLIFEPTTKCTFILNR